MPGPEHHKLSAAATAAPTTTAQASAQASASPAQAETDAGAAPSPAVVAAAVSPESLEAPAAIVGRFHDRVGGSYRLLGVRCLVDGVEAYRGSPAEAAIFQVHVSPGDHAVSVVADYEGKGAGVFSYMNAYRFKVKVGRVFPVRDRETAQVTITAFERGGVTAKYEERLTLALDVR